MSSFIAGHEEDIALVMALKLKQLQREQLNSLTMEHFTEYLIKYQWRKHRPDSISQAVIEIMNVNADNIVGYLSQRAVIDAKYQDISDFNSLFRKRR